MDAADISTYLQTIAGHSNPLSIYRLSWNYLQHSILRCRYIQIAHLHLYEYRQRDRLRRDIHFNEIEVKGKYSVVMLSSALQ